MFITVTTRNYQRKMCINTDHVKYFQPYQCQVHGTWTEGTTIVFGNPTQYGSSEYEVIETFKEIQEKLASCS